MRVKTIKIVGGAETSFKENQLFSGAEGM